MAKLIADLTAAVPKALAEPITLGRTLKKCADDVLAHFDRRPQTPTPTPSIGMSPFSELGRPTNQLATITR